MHDLTDELDPPFEILEPAEWRGAILFNSPHSGCVYPRPFLSASRLEIGTLRRSEDSFVDELMLGVVARGHPLMRAHFPRCYVDVNREPYELDPRMFDGRLPSFANTRSMRVAGGLGTVARVVGDAQEIYDQRIAVGEALRRIDGLYKPYHRALRRLFMRLHRDFGAAMLNDCHSMPSTTGARDERPRADLVLGDRYGTSCVPVVAGTIELVAEAIVFLEAYGVDTKAALEVLGGGLAGSTVLQRKGAAMLARDFKPGFRIALHDKDMGIVTAAAIMGSHVRVGLEDSLYVGKGQLAESNADQVRKIRGILEALSLEIATPAEARQLLGLPDPSETRREVFGAGAAA